MGRCVRLLLCVLALSCVSATFSSGVGQCPRPHDQASVVWVNHPEFSSCPAGATCPAGNAATPAALRWTRQALAECEGCLVFMGTDNSARLSLPSGHNMPGMSQNGIELHFADGRKEQSLANDALIIADVRSRVPAGQRGPIFVYDMRWDLISPWVQDLTGALAPDDEWFLETDRSYSTMAGWFNGAGGEGDPARCGADGEGCGFSKCYRAKSPHDADERWNAPTGGAGADCNRAYNGTAGIGDGEFGVRPWDFLETLRTGLGDRAVGYTFSRGSPTMFRWSAVLGNRRHPGFRAAKRAICDAAIAAGYDACDFGHKRHFFWTTAGSTDADHKLSLWVDIGDGMGGLEALADGAISGTLDSFSELNAIAFDSVFWGRPEIPNGVAGCATAGGCEYDWMQDIQGQVEQARESYDAGQPLVRLVSPYLYSGCPEIAGQWDNDANDAPAYDDELCANLFDDSNGAVCETCLEREIVQKSRHVLVDLGGKSATSTSIGSGGGSGWSADELCALILNPPGGGPRPETCAVYGEAGHSSYGVPSLYCGEPNVANPGVKIAGVDIPVTVTKIQGTTCAAPCAVHFDATATDDPTLTREFHSLNFEWDFGDETAGTWPITGLSRNADIGAIAGHPYVNPGTYTWAVRAIRPDRTTAGTKVGSVTVREPSGDAGVYANGATVCFKRAAVPVDGVDGCPPNATEVQRADGDLDAAIAALSGGISTAKRVTLARATPAEEWTVSSALVLGAAGGIIDSYGTGARPKITVTVADGGTLFTGANGWTIAGLEISMSNDLNVLNAAADLQGVTLYDLIVNGSYVHIFGGGGGSLDHQRVAIVDVQAIKSGLTSGAFASYCFYGAISRYLNLGNTCDFALLGASDVSEFPMRHNGLQRGVVAHGRFKGQGTSANGDRNPIQIRTGEDGAYTTEFVNIHDMQLGTKESADFLRTCTSHFCTNTAGNPLRNLIAERLFLWIETGTPTSGAGSQAINLQGSDITIRNIVYDAQGANAGGTVNFVVHGDGGNANQGTLENIHVLGNTVYRGSVSGGGALNGCSSEAGSAGMECRGNLVAQTTGTITAVGAGWTGSGNVARTDAPFVAAGAQGTTTAASFRLPSTNVTVKGQGYDASARTDLSLVQDFDGHCRPAETTVDAGAFEEASAPCP